MQRLRVGRSWRGSFTTKGRTMTTGSVAGPNYEHRRRRHPRRPHSTLAERWTLVDGVDVFYRESPTPPNGRVMMHVHGFGLSGQYLLPTAERLADEFHTLVPDLPGLRAQRPRGRRPRRPDLAHAAARFLDDRGVERVTLVGNSMGCPVICEFAHLYPDRLERAVLVSPAGGVFNQPLTRAVGQLSQGRSARAPQPGRSRDSRLSAVRRAEHLPDVQGPHAVPDARASARDAGPDARRAGQPGSAAAGP